MSLTEFLLARYAERKAAAVAARAKAEHNAFFGDTAAEALLGLAESEGAERAALEHFAHWGPTAAIAIVESLEQVVSGLVYFMEGDYAPWNERFLRELAMPFADHPDWREEWRP